jgi:hypothetical protein
MPTDAALAAVAARLDDIAAALRLTIATQQTHGEMLAKILEAACPPEDGGALEGALRRVAGALREQTDALERVEAELSGIGSGVEAGVIRGLAHALGVSGTDDEADVAAKVGARSREGAGSRPPEDGAEPAGLAGGC